MLRLLTVLLPLCFLPLFAFSQSAQPPAKPGDEGDLLPFKAAEKTLPNGLKVMVIPTGFPNLVSVQIPVQTGARNEVEPGKSGFAHFFEHMMFRGTKEYPPDKYEAIMTRAGARTNAYTTDDYTNYHATFAKEDLETVLKLEADRFQNLSYAEEAFKTESRAVLGEYNKNSANPLTKLFEVQRDHAFTTHTYKHTTMGFLKDIEDMPNQFAYSREFFGRWYRPEYATVIVAGDVVPDQVFPIVEKYWGSWKRGSYSAQIPPEPAAHGPVYAHVPWGTPTPPWVTVGFHAPAFSETDKEYAALDLALDLYFGQTSDLYKRLVEDQQLVDQFFPFNSPHADPELATIAARVKKPADALLVRDEILKTVAAARARLVPAQRLEDAKSNNRHSFTRQLDNTEAIASTLARFVRFRRSFDTLNAYFRTLQTLTPEDLRAAARKYFTDQNLVLATLSKDALPEGIDRPASLGSLESALVGPAAGDVPLVQQKTALPLINVKLLFGAGSVRDPAGREGLAALTAAMIADGGSKALRTDEINKAFFPMAASFDGQVDKEMTSFTGICPRDAWEKFFDVALPMLLDPGFRDEDFRRLKDRQLAALETDLRSNNEEELGRERLAANVFAGTAYGRPAIGTVAGIKAITLDDVKNFVKTHYTRANLTVGLAGDAPDDLTAALRREVGRLPAGEAAPPTAVAGRRPRGLEVEIIKKDTRATAISFGLPIEVTRSHPDFAALSVARAWLGEHRSSMSHLYQRIRELRGMNYGDYAYIEAFPGAMYTMFPYPNVVRRAQIFDVWIRPVTPENGHMALRIALYELDKLIEKGMTQEDFERTREYLMKNVYLLTATENQQLGYALDSRWYGIGEYTSSMRERLATLTRDDVNRAIRRHLSAKDLSVVIITKDAEGLRDKLVGDAFSPIKYDAPKPKELLAEDKAIGALKLNIKPDAVRITPVENVFAK